MQAEASWSTMYGRDEDLFEWLEEMEAWGKSHFSFCAGPQKHDSQLLGLILL